MAKKVEDPVSSEPTPALSMPEGEDQARWDRWTAFLAEARKVNPARFDGQLANGEFAMIPASFL